MTQKQRSGPVVTRAAAYQPISPDPQLTADRHGWPRPWFDLVPWWSRPDLAYRKGLEDGIAIAQARRNAEDDAIWRKSVENIGRYVEVVDNRRRAAG